MTPFSVVQVSAAGQGGGAEGIARALHEGYRLRGVDAALLVGLRAGGAGGVTRLHNGSGAWALHDRLRGKDRPRAARIARAFADPRVVLDAARGHEDFRFPSTAQVVEAARAADVVQLHNLHGAYFDLRRLPELSETANVVWCPHDMWPVTGHCAHSLGWDGWRTGCGDCPHLRTYPALLRDGTAFNWRRKQAIYAQSKLRVGVPCRWLADVIADSMLAPAVEELRVIPNGIDLKVFRPGGREEARRRLDVASDVHLLVFAAQDPRRNEFKDYGVLVDSLDKLAAGESPPILVAALGAATASTRRVGRMTLREVPRVPPDEVATWLRAADVYVHPSRADTFPLGVLEAMACGAPVVASAVGGIPEQVDAVTGTLVPPADAQRFADAVAALLGDKARRHALGEQAARRAAALFDRERQVDAYVDWFSGLKRRRSA